MYTTSNVYHTPYYILFDGKGTKENLLYPDKVNMEFPKVCLYSNILYRTLGSVPINVKFLLRVPYVFYCKAIYV